MQNSIINRFIQVLKEYSFILNRDFNEITNVQPHKREVFINRGVKIFLTKVLEEMKIFQINIQHYIDAQLTESFLDIIISLKVYREKICEYIVYSPIKGHLFHTDKDNVYFNNRIISIPVQNKNLIKLDSNNVLFLHNLYVCYMLTGCFQEIIIEKAHLEKNKYGLEIIKKIPYISIEESNDRLKIYIKE